VRFTMLDSTSVTDLEESQMELDDVKRFDSGVVLLTYLPAS